MKSLLDTSVLVSCFYGDHEHHAPSIALLVKQNPSTGYTAAHCLAEFYAVVTGMPGKERASPDEALLFLRELEKRLTLLHLEATEYFDVLETAGSAAIIGGATYDAIIATCASKAKAQVLYTWNVKHFERLGASLGLRVRQP
ncbi:MAG TPA: PIN domain-containing protein [Steroidobacteraceae bacterium]|nr:PIN domain-containing protein [Steroidobacteraceae bacterium]